MSRSPSQALRLGAEVIWTRILSLLFGGTVYTFSLIAAAFLCGLGIGSAKGAWLARYSERPGLLLAGFQLGAAVSIAWGAALMNRAYPYWPIDPALAPGPWFNFQIDLVRAFIAIVPAACFWGASFPLALAAAGTEADDPARGVGTIYAANTIGAVIGALVFSLLIIPAFGTQDAQRLLIWAALAAAAVMLMWPPPTDARTPLAAASRWRSAGWSSPAPPPRPLRRSRRMSLHTAVRSPPSRAPATFTKAKGSTRRSRCQSPKAASATFTSAEKSKRPPKSTTCDCSGCSATFPP
jgi:spermidine synthase